MYKKKGLHLPEEYVESVNISWVQTDGMRNFGVNVLNKSEIRKDYKTFVLWFMLVFNYVLSLQVTFYPLIRRQDGLITGSHVIGGENLNRKAKGKEKDGIAKG